MTPASERRSSSVPDRRARRGGMSQIVPSKPRSGRRPRTTNIATAAAGIAALDLDVARTRPALRALVALNRAGDRLLGRRETTGAQTWPAGVAPGPRW